MKTAMLYILNKAILLPLLLLYLVSSAASGSSSMPEHIKVGVYDNPPKLFIDKDGKPAGIFIDITDAIAANEGFTVEYVYSDWNSLLEKLRRREIDVLPDMAYSVGRDSLFTLGKLSVMNSWLEIFTTQHANLSTVSDMKGKTVGVLKSSIQEDYLRKVLLPQYSFELLVYPDYSQSVDALKSGKIDLLVAGRFFNFSEYCDHSIIPTGIIFLPTDLYFAFAKNNNELADIFDRNISLLKNDPQSAYYESLKRWFYKAPERSIPRYIIWVFALILLVLIIVTLFAFLLRYQVKEQTKSLRQSNDALLVAKEKAEESHRMKTIFLQNISHEIRTPLNGILGFAGLLGEAKIDEKRRREYADIILRSGNRLLKTINDIIEIADIESQRLIPRTTPVNISELFMFQFRFFEQQANEKGLKLIYAPPTHLDDVMVMTDREMLNGIVTNLIGNAIKFTDTGSVEFGFYVENQELVFSVSDTGPGIHPNLQHRIFERFVKAENYPATSHEGSGLGLAIAKAYSDILGGRIWFTSEIAKGTRFYFAMPTPDTSK